MKAGLLASIDYCNFNAWALSLTMTANDKYRLSQAQSVRFLGPVMEACFSGKLSVFCGFLTHAD